MDEVKSSLVEIYQGYHLNDDTAGTKELQESLLYKQGRAFLCSSFVKPKDRFLYLNLDFYKSILLKIATCENFEKQDGDGNVLKRLVDGFHNLEKYAINLWKFPWRKEYHTIKLYTAFFKCNVQKQLQDTDSILSILKSLGYIKTPEQDQVQVKDPDITRALWVSLDLYLVQLDLLIIKEIMDKTNNSELSLRDFVKARAKTSDIKDACQLLSTTRPKRPKLEETQEDKTSSQRRLKQRTTGETNPTANIKHVAATGAVSNSKSSILTSATEATAMDTDETSTSAEGIKSVLATNAYNAHSNINPATFMSVPDRDLYGEDTEENHLGGDKYQDQFGAPHNTSHQTRYPSNFDVPNRMMHTSGRGFHSLSHLDTMTSSRLDRHDYSQNWKDLHGTRGDYPSNGVQPPKSDTRPVHPGITSVGRQWRDNSGSDRYAHNIIRQTGSPASQQFESNELLRTDRRIDSVSRQNDSSLMADKRRIFPAEPMEVEHTELNHVHNVDSHFKRVPEGGHPRSEALSVGSGHNRSQDLSPPRSKEIAEGTSGGLSAHSSVCELDNTLQLQLSLKNGTPKEAALRSSRVRDAISTRAGKEIDTGASVVSNRSLGAASAGYDASTDPADGRRYTLHKREENDLPHNTRQDSYSALGKYGNDPARYGQGQGMSDQSLQTVKSTRPGSNLVPGAEASLKKDPQFEGTASNRDAKKVDSLCNHCSLQGDLICKSCLLIICEQCEKIFDTNLCEQSKGAHVFEKLKDEGARNNTAGEGASTSSRPDVEVADWPCYQCTYLNSPKHRVCIMCGASHGGQQVEQLKPGSSVCRFCTLLNDMGTKVCIACHKTLDRHETFV